MRRKILVSAYACEPGKGSEQGVGWQWVRQLSRCGDVTVITRANNRGAIESHAEGGLSGAVEFVYYDLPAWIVRRKRGAKWLYPYYCMWQWGAFLRARKLHKAAAYDYVVALTFGSIWMPTFMHLLGARFIWGPIGGGESVPRALWAVLGFKARCLQALRLLLNVSARLNPVILSPIRRASLVLVRTQDTARIIPARYRFKTHVVLETGVSEQLLESLAPAELLADGVLRVVYTGRLVSVKGVSLALRAVALAQEAGVRVSFAIVGDGPERASLERVVRQLGMENCVRMMGARPMSDVVSELKGAQVYLFPSFKEGGAWSLMEAMAAGLPIVCVNTSGMAVLTDEASAIRVMPGLPEAMVRGFADALMMLARDPARRRDMGRASRCRIATCFGWASKGDLLAKLMDRVELAHCTSGDRLGGRGE